MSGRFIENPAVLRRLARSQGWDCVLDATSNQGRGPLRQRFPDQWHLIERNGVRRPELHPGITISEAFRGGWVSSLFVSRRWRSPKRSRLCAQHVVAVVGHLPVLEVSEGTLRALEDSLHFDHALPYSKGGTSLLASQQRPASLRPAQFGEERQDSVGEGRVGTGVRWWRVGGSLENSPMNITTTDYSRIRLSINIGKPPE